LLTLPVLIVMGLYFYAYMSADRELRAALAEADRSDPHWRLEDVEADRAAVPEAENSATPTMAAKQLLPKNCPFWDFPADPAEPPDAQQKRRDLQASFQDLEPQRQLNEEQTTALRAEMKRAEAALAEARKLADLSNGRYPITYSPDFIGTLIPHEQDAREAAALLSNDALLRAQEKDPDGALASCRGALNAGRSIGDEPLVISQLVRIACRASAAARAERVLAQGEPSEEALRQFQELLEKEEPEPLLLISIRGERAGEDRLMEGIQSGKIKISARDLAITARFNGENGPSYYDDAWMKNPAYIRSQRAAMLRYMNKAVALAKLPPEQGRAAIRKLDVTDQPIFVRILAPALGKTADACARSQAQLRCAVAAAAAERYRRAKGRWPDALDALKQEGYLPDVPADPYDGKPLRWLRLEDGAEVYSIGPDGEDNSGKMDRQNLVAPGTDIGFRLWDAAQRRQPAAALKPAAGPDDGGPPGAGQP
jgi:hypothetical protein